MKMTMEQLRRVATNLLAVLRSQLPDLAAIRAKVGAVIDPGAEDRYAGEEFVDVTAANGGRLVVVYRRRNGQAPIMVIVRPSTYKIMITAEQELDGYEVFDEEPDIGLMQDRSLEGDFGVVLAELERLAAARAPEPRAAASGKVRETPRAYELLCSACGKPASHFQRGMYPGDDHLIYFDVGGERRWMFSGSDSEEMERFLAGGDLAGLQKYVLESCTFQPVVDAYCPECDAASCKDHCRREPSEGGRSRTVTCPAGHARELAS